MYKGSGVLDAHNTSKMISICLCYFDELIVEAVKSRGHAICISLMANGVNSFYGYLLVI